MFHGAINTGHFFALAFNHYNTPIILLEGFLCFAPCKIREVKDFYLKA